MADNDYSKFAEDAEQAAQNVESLNAPDPDIESLVDQAKDILRMAAGLSESRSG